MTRAARTQHRTTLIGLLVLAVCALVPGVAAARASSYWLVSSTGQVFAYGHARTYGSEAGRHFAGRVRGIKGTADGKGYWIVTTKTRYAFGDARRHAYRAGRLKPYKGRVRPRGLRGRIVGYAPATIHAPSKHRSGTGTRTTTPAPAPGTPAPTAATPAPAPSCADLAIPHVGLADTTANMPYAQSLSATGVSGGTWRWALTYGSLPTGLTLSTDGRITGTPAMSAAGTLSGFSVQASNSQCPHNSAQMSFALTTTAPTLHITTASLPDGSYGVMYATTTLAATGDGQPADFQWSASGLPAGMSISTAGVITGAPSIYGTYTVWVTVTDPVTDATGTASFTLTIGLPPLQIVSPSTMPGGQDTVAYPTTAFSAYGGSGFTAPAQYRSSYYTWSATGLPAGMSFSQTGVLSGTPTQDGIFNVRVTVSDTTAGDGVAPYTQTFELDIALAPFGFTTSTLTAMQGVPFTGTVVAHGGQAPYTMYRLSGQLPAGLTFYDGTISGTTTAPAGDYPITIAAIDSENSPQTMQETFDVWVAPAGVSPNLNIPSGPADGNPWAGYVEQDSSPFTDVSGTFTVPEIKAGTNADLAAWVGIDGYGTNGVLQAGITALSNPSQGTVSYQAWYELYPSPVMYRFDVAAGDTINVNIWNVGATNWEMTLNDLTSGQGFATEQSYTGPDLCAEWILEIPDGATDVGYPSTATFSNLRASQPGTGMLDLTRPGAIPGTLSANGFSITSN